jgi:hypothetical protein
MHVIQQVHITGLTLEIIKSTTSPSRRINNKHEKYEMNFIFRALNAEVRKSNGQTSLLTA